MRFMYATKTIFSIFALLAIGLGLSACQDAGKGEDEGGLKTPAELDVTVGSLCEIWQFGEIPVIGYGIGTGVNGTGSSECDPQLKTDLVKYIWQQIPDARTVKPREFISSKDTAVVKITGTIPPVALAGETFDLKVEALEQTQTTSLAGGRLFTAELKERSRYMGYGSYTKTVASAQGPVFIDRFGGSGAAGETLGYVLAGGRVAEDAVISLVLLKPDYHIASTIRNRLYERFGPKSANAVSPGEIRLKIPPEYREYKDRFLGMVGQMYLTEDQQLRQKRVEMLIGSIVAGKNAFASELALEAIGRGSLEKLSPHLKSSDESVRFRVARCMFSIGDDRGLAVLKAIVSDPSSTYRIEGIEAVGRAGKPRDLAPVLNRLLRDDNFDVRFAAYKQLRKINDISISKTLVNGDFFVETVICGGGRVVYVSRSGVPRIVLFGAPVKCADNIFADSADGDIIINARPEDRFVSIIRRFPNETKLLGPFKATFDLADIIRTLGYVPATNNDVLVSGLGVTYDDIVALLERMCDNGTVEAEFIAGAMAQ